MPTHPVLIAGEWRAARATGTFRADNPAAGEPLPDEYPVSAWEDVDAALSAGMQVRLAVRPGNAPVPSRHGYDTIRSLNELAFASHKTKLL